MPSPAALLRLRAVPATICSKPAALCSARCASR